jgi:hypothetical protein
MFAIANNKTLHPKHFVNPTPKVLSKPAGIISSNEKSSTGTTIKYAIMNDVHSIRKIMNIIKLPAYQPQ